MKPPVLFLLLLMASFSLLHSSAQTLPLPRGPVGVFENHVDVGNPKRAGASRYDESTQSYFITGGGYNIWFNRDEFHYLYKKISGDFLLTANFELIGNENGNGHRKTGWMIRESIDEAAVSANACLHGDGLAVLQWRPLRGAYMRDPADEIFFPKKNYQIIQLERVGKRITMRLAHLWEPLQMVSSVDLPDMKDQVLVGLYVLAHDTNSLQEARIWNVRIDQPVANDFHPNPAVKLPPTQNTSFASRLETLNVKTGARKVVCDWPGKMESPNWTPDGQRLLFNADGALHSISLDGKSTEKLNTGSLPGINSGHLISPDGKQLAISAGDTASRIYILPLQGGTPKLLTEKSPSRAHGWSPDGRELYYSAQRDSQVFNLYKIAVDGALPEVQLTSNKTGHVDGPDVSPDGHFVCFNANDTGTMQLWRMNPDGSDHEQLTFDENHNWFPHVSPDGKWIAYLSFPPDIDPNSAPSFKHVTLRLVPASGGSPKVIAYLYGGQGTLDAPSWSPDSSSLAFVSNSHPAHPE